jgi:hypothetical protein
MKGNEGWLRDCNAQELEWFKLWYEFLKLSPRRAWSKKVVEYFGDVSGTFEDWLPSHKYLFRMIQPVLIDEVESIEDYDECSFNFGDPGCKSVDTAILFVRFFAGTKKDLRDAFEELLTKYHDGRVGAPDFTAESEYLGFMNKPDTEMLKKILAVYQAYSADQKKPKSEQMALWQIEEEVSKTTPLINKQHASWIWDPKNKEPAYELQRRKSQHATVRKYLNYAEEILAHVVKNDFPVYNVGKPRSVTGSKVEVSDDDEIIDEFGDNLYDCDYDYDYEKYENLYE